MADVPNVALDTEHEQGGRRSPLGPVLGALLAPMPGLAARIERSPLGARLAHGAFWSTAGALGARVLTLVSAVATARALGVVEYGELGVLQATVGMFLSVAGLGMGTTAAKFVAELRQHDAERAGRIIGLSNGTAMSGGAAMAVLAFVLAPWLASSVLAAPELADELRIGSALMLLGSWNAAQIGTLSGFEAFREAAAAGLASALLTLLFTVGGAWAGGLTGAVCGLLAATAGSCLVHRAVLARVLRRVGVQVRIRGALKEWRVLLEFGLPSALSAFFITPVNWLCQAIIVNEPGGYEQMGLFNAASQWRVAILFLPVTVGSVALPVLANLAAAGDRARYRKVLLGSIGVTAAIALAAAAIIAGAAPFIMRVYGHGFADGATVLVVLAGSAVLTATLTVIGQALASAGRMWWGFVLNALWGAAIVSFTFMMRERGAMALSLANLFACLVQLLPLALFFGRQFASSRRAAANPAT